MEIMTKSEAEELKEILARGCLRLILKHGKMLNKQLKQLDFLRAPSDQLDRELTTNEKGRKS